MVAWSKNPNFHCMVPISNEMENACPTLIVALSCPEAWNGIRKLRIDHSKANKKDLVVLEQAIISKCCDLNLISSDDKHFYSLQVYDNSKDSFLSIKQAYEATVDKLPNKILALLIRITPSVSWNTNKSGVFCISHRYLDYEEGIVSVHSNDSIINLTIHEDPNTGKGTGLNVWDGSLLLTKYLAQHDHIVKNKHVLELGAGCGVVGLAAGVLGAASIVLTDLSYCQSLLQSNINANKHLINCHCACQVYDWFQPHLHSFDPCLVDIILVADCVWLESLVLPLIQALVHLVGHNETKKTVYMSYQRRGKNTHELLIKQLSAKFAVDSLPIESLGKFPHQTFFIFKCTAKQ